MLGGEDRRRISTGARGEDSAEVGVDDNLLGEVPGVGVELGRSSRGARTRQSGGTASPRRRRGTSAAERAVAAG